MKTKKKMKNDQKKASDPTLEKDLGKSSSQSERRSSLRIQSMHKSTTPGSKKLNLVDSAYDADEESVTPNSSPDQKAPLNKDPYEMDMTDDDEAPVLKLKQRKKNNTKKVAKQIPTKKSKKVDKSPVANPKNMPTSTPVLHSNGGSTQENSLSATPEVTPILPYKPHDCASPTNNSFATPQIHRPSRKRSLAPDSLVGFTVELSYSSLSYSSQGDSGIAMSPMTKKQRTSLDIEKHAPQVSHTDLKKLNKKKNTGPQSAVSEILTTEQINKNRNKSDRDSFFGFDSAESSKSQKTNITDNRMKEQKHLSHIDLNKINEKKNTVSQSTVSETLTKEQININRNKSDRDSFFGFDSFESPAESALPQASENSPPVRSRRVKLPRKTVKPVASKDAYRSACKNSSDSSLTCLTNDRIPLDGSETSQESLPRANSASPTLFSDSFSADSESVELEVNKSTTKAYSKSMKARRTNKPTASKVDEWASNFNMEIEDIEKFDLNIE